MKRIYILIIFLLSLWACGPKPVPVHISKEPSFESSDTTRKACNAVYYWKTTFAVSDSERQFLADNHIGRMYIRYFDIYMDPDFYYGTPAPEATIRFKDSVPQDIEIVPTVFIDNELFKRCDMAAYSARVAERIMTMSRTNDVGNVHEVQLDCDWTKTTETAYFAFLQSVRSELTKHQITLSVTIRLHQLNMPVPPVDRGVLMCYNTGAVRSNDTRNSILQSDDVSLYARNLKSYQLPLDIAYPTFTWAVWFANGTFEALLRNADPASENLTHKEGNRYTVNTGFYQERKYLAAGDEIRFEFSDYHEIMQTKKLLEHQLSNYSVILYHLDNTNLSKYNKDEISEIYRH